MSWGGGQKIKGLWLQNSWNIYIYIYYRSYPGDGRRGESVYNARNKKRSLEKVRLIRDENQVGQDKRAGQEENTKKVGKGLSREEERISQEKRKEKEGLEQIRRESRLGVEKKRGQ